MGFSERAYFKSPVWLQNLMVTSKGLFIQLERFGRKFEAKMEEFDRNQWLSYEELIQYQSENLRKLISHSFENVPYYNEVMKKSKLTPGDIKTTEDLYKLPILTRQDIRKNFDKLRAVNYPSRTLEKGHTSGSTGSPLQFLWDKNIILITNVVDWRQKNWAGLKIGDKTALIYGRIVVPLSQKKPPFWRINKIHGQLFLSSFHLKKDNIKYYIDILKKFKPLALEAYPSTAYLLAKYIIKFGEKIPLTSVLTTSETLFDSHRKVIEEAFSCQVYDFYGMAERGIFATECSYHEGQHINMDYGIVEIVDRNNKNLPPGESGKLITTGLHNYGMPLIRYATTDISSISSRQCSCGRAFPLMDRVTTRAEDFIIAPDGTLISPIVLQHPFKPLKTVVESQIIQEDVNNLTIKIVKDDGYSDKDTDFLQEELGKRIGTDIEISFEFVDNIPRSKAGKLKWVISKIPLEI